MIETTDLLFAVDSIPAIFAVTRDPFIVYTSNVFAILGLRALFFVLAGMLDKFHYLKPGVALILVFVGLKMILTRWVHVPIGISLAVVLLTLAGAVLLSVWQVGRRESGVGVRGQGSGVRGQGGADGTSRAGNGTSPASIRPSSRVALNKRSASERLRYSSLRAISMQVSTSMREPIREGEVP